MQGCRARRLGPSASNGAQAAQGEVQRMVLSAALFRLLLRLADEISDAQRSKLEERRRHLGLVDLLDLASESRKDG